MLTYGKGAKLAGSTLLPNGRNLRQLARDAQDTSSSLQVAQGLHVEDVRSEESGGAAGHGGDEDGSEAGAAAKVEDEDGNDDILAEDEGSLAVGAEGELVAVVVGEGDEVGARLEEVGQEGDALSRARVGKLQDLGNLDDGGGGDDADAQALADGELEAGLVVEGDVEEKSLVALLANDGHAEVADGRGEIVGDGLDGGAEGVHLGGCGG